MDIDQVLKNLKGDHDTLVRKEQELSNKIRDIKTLREAVAAKKVAVDKLEEEVKKLLG